MNPIVENGSIFGKIRRTGDGLSVTNRCSSESSTYGSSILRVRKIYVNGR